jgi:hypothetical protein
MDIRAGRISEGMIPKWKELSIICFNGVDQATLLKFVTTGLTRGLQWLEEKGKISVFKTSLAQAPSSQFQEDILQGRQPKFGKISFLQHHDVQPEGSGRICKSPIGGYNSQAFHISNRQM